MFKKFNRTVFSSTLGLFWDNLLSNVVFSMLINYIRCMSHFLYFAHNLLQQKGSLCISDLLEQKNKEKKSVLFYKLKISLLASTTTISLTQGTLFCWAALASWYWDITWHNLWRTEILSTLLLPEPLHKSSCLLELSASQPEWNDDAVSQQCNFLLLKTSLRASYVQHLQLP